jgi:hypothetical protein
MAKGCQNTIGACVAKHLSRYSHREQQVRVSSLPTHRSALNAPVWANPINAIAGKL